MTEPKKCPKCGGNMIDSLPRATYNGQKLSDLRLLNWLCLVCGHEEKVK